MQISITEKEVNAIDFGLEQIRDAFGKRLLELGAEGCGSV